MISTRHRIGHLVAAGIALVTLTACSGSSSPEAAGTWGEDADGKPKLVLEKDGKLSGTDGCNQLSGSWEQDGPAVDFDGIAATMMECSDVDTWLQDLDTALIDGDTLRVSDASGKEIGSLSRAS